MTKTMSQRRDEDAAMFRVADPPPAPVMRYHGAIRVYFNRVGAAPMVWCVSPEDAAWELAVQRVTLESGSAATTEYRPKETPDDEDGRPSAWIAAHGHLRVYADGTATVTSD